MLIAANVSGLNDIGGMMVFGLIVIVMGLFGIVVRDRYADFWETLRWRNKLLQWYFGLFFRDKPSNTPGRKRFNFIVSVLAILIGVAVISIGLFKLSNLMC